MIKHSFLRVYEVAEILGRSKSYAYKIIQKLNAELKEQGFITIAGRVNKQYFLGKDLLRCGKRKGGELMAVYKEMKTNTWRVVYHRLDRREEANAKTRICYQAGRTCLGARITEQGHGGFGYDLR